MKSRRFLLGMLVMALAFGMTVVGCGEEEEEVEAPWGTFVLNDIPATYNGKYVFLLENDDKLHDVFGCESVDMSTGTTVTLVQISNGKASIPVWVDPYPVRYFGNNTGGISIEIFAKAIWDESGPIAVISFKSVKFSNGSATKSFKDGTLTTN